MLPAITGVKKELRESIEKGKIVNIASELAINGLKLGFKSPCAPYQSDIWEKLVLS